MKGAASPAGLLTALVVAVVFLLVALLAIEPSGREDPEARRAVRRAVAALRALPEGSPLLAVGAGERSGTLRGELPGMEGEAFTAEWTVLPLRWSAAAERFEPSAGGEPHELARITVRVRPRAAGAVPALPAAARTFLRADAPGFP